MTGNCKKPPDFIRTAQTRSGFSWPASASADERNPIFAYLEERFGLSAALFDDFLLFKKKDAWHLLRKSPWTEIAAEYKIFFIGLKSFHRIGGYIKPTTRFMQMFGSYAQKSRYELTEQELEKIMADEPLAVDLQIDPGYVILAHKGRIIGLGFFTQNKILPKLPRQKSK
jgi:NOL1/NOP2/fmu family ribosome biogenesis protein